MTKLGLGTIGTSWITDSFIEAALETKQYTLNCVYSRTEKRAQEFAGKYGNVSTETDQDRFFNNEDLDVIYIASPNSLHYEQTLKALQAGKHVIVEKPASTSEAEWDEMLTVAADHDVFVFEAAKHMHIPNLEKVSAAVNQLGEINGASFSYVRYSSRYDKVRAGEEPNIFSLKFSGGALMDLGIYPVYTAVALFGAPEAAHYFPKKIKTGVDGLGTVILQYKTFDVTIVVGKIGTSTRGVEIYGKDETLIIDHVSHLTKAKLMDAKSLEETALPLENHHGNDMIYEAEAFAQMINNKADDSTIKRYRELSNKARIVSGILHELRAKNNLIFEAEK